MCNVRWLFIAPLAMERALSWTDTGHTNCGLMGPFEHPDGSKSNVIPVGVMNRVVEYLGTQQLQAWVLEQKHGDLMFIPAGFAHAINNNGSNSLKYAMDFMPPGGIFQCVISHLYVSQLVKDKITQDYMHILDYVIPTVEKVFASNIKRGAPSSWGK